MINQQAGLGAMMQASPQPQRGLPASNMAQTMALAKKMSDGQLAEVLAGKNMNIPQYVAMTEAMGRKQLRTAMEGATAMTTAKAPSEKEKLMAMLNPQPQMPPQQPQMQGQMPLQAGVAAVPAPNMDTVGMAGGGIIAFKEPTEENNYSSVKDPRGDFDRNGPIGDLIDAMKTDGYKGEWWRDPVAAAQDVAGIPIRAVGTAGQYLLNKPLQSMGVPVPDVPPSMRYGPGTPSATSFMDTLKLQRQKGPLLEDESGRGNVTPQQQKYSAAIPGSGLSADQSGEKKVAAKVAGEKVGGGSTAAPGAGLKDALDLSQPDTSKRRNYLDALTAETADVQKQVADSKGQAQGEFLMQIGASLMSTPNFGVALSKGVQAGLPGLAANRKEANMLLKDQRDYKLNLAKAQEARDQGDEDLAFKYKMLAEQAAHHAGSIAVQNRMADAAMVGAQNRGLGAANRLAMMEQISLKDATAQFNKLTPRDKKLLAAQGITSPQAYFTSLNTGQAPSMMFNELPTAANTLAFPQ